MNQRDVYNPWSLYNSRVTSPISAAMLKVLASWLNKPTFIPGDGPALNAVTAKTRDDMYWFAENKEILESDTSQINNNLFNISPSDNDALIDFRYSYTMQTMVENIRYFPGVQDALLSVPPDDRYWAYMIESAKYLSEHYLNEPFPEINPNQPFDEIFHNLSKSPFFQQIIDTTTSMTENYNRSMIQEHAFESNTIHLSRGFIRVKKISDLPPAESKIRFNNLIQSGEVDNTFALTAKDPESFLTLYRKYFIQMHPNYATYGSTPNIDQFINLDARGQLSITTPGPITHNQKIIKEGWERAGNFVVQFSPYTIGILKNIMAEIMTPIFEEENTEIPPKPISLFIMLAPIELGRLIDEYIKYRNHDTGRMSNEQRARIVDNLVKIGRLIFKNVTEQLIKIKPLD